MQTVEASLASIIASTMPLAVGFAGWVVFRRTPFCAGRLGTLRWRGWRCAHHGSSDAGGGGFLWHCTVFHCGGFAVCGDFDGARRLIGGGNLLMIVGLQMLVGVGLPGHSGPHF